MSVEIFPGRYWAVMPAEAFEDYFPQMRAAGWKVLANKPEEDGDRLWFAFEVPKTSIVEPAFYEATGMRLESIAPDVNVNSLNPQELGVFDIPEPSWMYKADQIATAVQEGAEEVADFAGGALKAIGVLAGGFFLLNWLNNRNK